MVIELNQLNQLNNEQAKRQESGQSTGCQATRTASLSPLHPQKKSLIDNN